jgi:predicted transcriptional regulator
MNDKEITPYTADKDISWQEIINDLVDQVAGEDVNDIPEKVISATELLLTGMPYYKVAQKLGVTTATVKNWIKKYPPMALVLQRGRPLLAKWRIAKLEQQYLMAIEKSQEILDMDLYSQDGEEGVRAPNAKLTGVVAQQARFIIQQFTQVNNEISIKSDGESVTMAASGEALDYIAQKIAEHRDKEEPVEATYRVIDDKNTSEKYIPMLDEHGEPFYGEMGILDINEDNKIQCHICGNYYKSLTTHLYGKHEVPPDVYELTFMLEEGAIEDAEN